MNPRDRFRARRLPRPALRSLERRRRRSLSRATALEFALTAAARRADLDVVLLVDEAGLVVASSETDLNLDMLAAVTPIVGRGKASPRIRRDGQPLDMMVRPFELLGELLYAAALGGSLTARKRELATSMTASYRILG